MDVEVFLGSGRIYFASSEIVIFGAVRSMIDLELRGTYRDVGQKGRVCVFKGRVP